MKLRPAHVATLCLLLLPLPPAGADDDETRGTRRAPMPAVHVEECGGCHAPYPAYGLPADAWRGLMDGLDRHFGSDASLEPAQAATIRGWLIANAGTRPADRAAPLRITRTPWFRHEHDEVPAALWRSPAVKSPANCGACHRGAESGVYSEHDVRLPRTTSSNPRPSPTRFPAGEPNP
ncbi:MAG: diheme cytochrome c [Pseudomonadota bacterium]